jgi:SAM-dependent methyltransferase
VESDLLREQIAFYRARAPEYGRSGAYQHQLEAVKLVLRTMGPFEDVLELACGPGWWTNELVQIGGGVTAIDASPEILALNRGNVGNGNVSDRQADLFEWEPEREYDLVFIAFWLSHVPPDLMDGFLDKIRRSVRSHGKVFIVDQSEDFRDRPAPLRDGIREIRHTSDGRAFSVVKVYYHTKLLAARLRLFGFAASAQRVGESFFFILGDKQ